ncbi:MAG: acyltransferase [Pseudomonadota bacterium]
MPSDQTRPTLFSARVEASPIETMRAIAVLLLVTYHVIGAGPRDGLAVDYPHGLRVFSDFFIDLRMPVFAFVAGFVYGLRPVAPSALGRFLTGKLRRLAIPGAIAATLFFLALTVMEGRPIAEIWRIYLFPFAHYWFLQAILVIFAVFCTLDVATRGRFAEAFLLVACVLTLSPIDIPGGPFSVNSAIYLLPYFILGTVVVRRYALLRQYMVVILPIALIAAAAATWQNLGLLQETGALSTERRDLQSLSFGIAACVIGILVLPRLGWLAWLGPPSFTIYLYHVFATSGMRQALEAVGVTQTVLFMVCGIAAGVLLPIILHWMAGQTALTRRLVLGQRR